MQLFKPSPTSRFLTKMPCVIYDSNKLARLQNHCWAKFISNKLKVKNFSISAISHLHKVYKKASNKMTKIWSMLYCLNFFFQ